MYIFVSNNKEEKRFDFLQNVHSRLVERFEIEVDTSQPLHLKTINGFLGRIYHFDRDTIKLIINSLSQRELVEVRKGSGIANYFIIIKRGEAR